MSGVSRSPPAHIIGMSQKLEGRPPDSGALGTEQTEAQKTATGKTRNAAQNSVQPHSPASNDIHQPGAEDRTEDSNWEDEERSTEQPHSPASNDIHQPGAEDRTDDEDGTDDQMTRMGQMTR